MEWLEQRASATAKSKARRSMMKHIDNLVLISLFLSLICAILYITS